MAWNYPEISLEDFVKLVKGFVDMLILASGYQSSGLIAHWDAENCRKAFQWGIFFENVLGSIISSEAYGESVRELDEAISEMKSNPLFPQGLKNLSSNTLSNAREFVLEHLMNNLPSRDEHLHATLVATLELGDDVMDITVRKLLKRQSAVSCVPLLEMGLDILSKSIETSCWTKDSLKEGEDPISSRRGRQLVELSTWNSWKTDCLLYFLSKRTVRLVSGAGLIFSAPKIQWVEVLKRLCVSSESDVDIFHEKIELLLLGCLANRWTDLVEHFMSVSYKSVSMSEQFEELQKLLLENSRCFNHSEVHEILGYLTELLGGRVQHLWRMPSALIAAAIPSWSPLFHLYFGEIETRMKLGFSTRRCCSCNQDLQEHKNCELAERVWCLYIFHVCGFNQINR